MDWSQLCRYLPDDVASYILLYVVSLMIGIPTVRKITKDWDVPRYATDLIVICYIVIFLAIILSPVTILLYWVLWKVVLYGILYRFLFRIVIVKTADLSAPDTVREVYQETMKKE